MDSRCLSFNSELYKPFTIRIDSCFRSDIWYFFIEEKVYDRNKKRHIKMEALRLVGVFWGGVTYDATNILVNTI